MDIKDIITLKVIIVIISRRLMSSTSNALCMMLMGLATSLPIIAQDFRYSNEIQQLDSAQFHQRFDSIFADGRKVEGSKVTIRYYLSRRNSDHSRSRYGLIEIQGETAVETFFVWPKIVDPFAEDPVYVDSVDQKSQSISVERSIQKAIRSCDENLGYFIQTVSLNGEKVLNENDVSIIIINKSGRNILSIVKYGPNLIDYERILKHKNRTLEKVVIWALDFYARKVVYMRD